MKVLNSCKATLAMYSDRQLCIRPVNEKTRENESLHELFALENCFCFFFFLVANTNPNVPANPKSANSLCCNGVWFRQHDDFLFGHLENVLQEITQINVG